MLKPISLTINYKTFLNRLVPIIEYDVSVTFTLRIKISSSTCSGRIKLVILTSYDQ